MRSNSLSTKGCGERIQTVNFVEVRFVVTVRQIIENWPKGQVLWCCCSRTVTDCYDAIPRGSSWSKISTKCSAAWPSQNAPCFAHAARVSRATAKILTGSVPTSKFVPSEIEMRQGTQRALVSSWMPPESVRASFALLRGRENRGTRRAGSAAVEDDAGCAALRQTLLGAGMDRKDDGHFCGYGRTPPRMRTSSDLRSIKTG
jgi:hypothetical protein